MAVAVISFIHDLTFDDIPAEVVERTRFWLLDLLGVAAAGVQTELSRIIRDHACAHFAGAHRAARLVFDGRKASPAGAALATGMTIDSIDAHDGHRLTKGHAGCGSLAAALALIDAENISDERELLVALVLGYEIGTRAGIALHRTAADYHTSGGWISITSAAIAARLLRLTGQATRDAVGIGEFHGPRGLMMRCIDHPTMVKDGSGWGAMAGVSAAYLARDGFTGAPASILESDVVADLWSDLGERWHIFDQYYKAYPVCRWAQPAVEAALALKAENRIDPLDISRVEVVSFDEAIRLSTRRPDNTEQAQYSLPFSVAAALVNSRLGVREITGAALDDAETIRLSEGMVLINEPDMSALFPDRRVARVRIVLKSGTTVSSKEMEAIGEPEEPVSTRTAQQKFFAYARPILGLPRCGSIAQIASNLGTTYRRSSLCDEVLTP